MGYCLVSYKTKPEDEGETVKKFLDYQKESHPELKYEEGMGFGLSFAWGLTAPIQNEPNYGTFVVEDPSMTNQEIAKLCEQSGFVTVAGNG